MDDIYEDFIDDIYHDDMEAYDKRTEDKEKYAEKHVGINLESE